MLRNVLSSELELASPNRSFGSGYRFAKLDQTPAGVSLNLKRAPARSLQSRQSSRELRTQPGASH